MAGVDERTIGLILRDGPFEPCLVEEWPEAMRLDYLELMAIDLKNLGLEEFKIQSRMIGETYLLSIGEPIHANSFLLKAWASLTDGAPPPPPLRFQIEEVP